MAVAFDRRARQEKEPEQQSGEVEYPPDHQPGMQVPKGGSCCANCRYLGGDQTSCTSPYFQKWHGSAEIPAPIDEFCSDWWEPQ